MIGIMDILKIDKRPLDFINAHRCSPNNLDIEGGIITFISKNIYDGNFYFIGLYMTHTFCMMAIRAIIFDTENNILQFITAHCKSYTK